MICLSDLLDLHVFQMKQGKKIGKTTGFAARIDGCGIEALTIQTDSGQQKLLKLNYVKSVGAFGLTIDQEDAFISEAEISDFLLFDVQALRKVIAVDENGQFLGTILDMEWMPEQIQMRSFILLERGEKVKIFYPNISVMGQDMIVLNVRFPNYDSKPSSNMFQEEPFIQFPVDDANQIEKKISKEITDKAKSHPSGEADTNTAAQAVPPSSKDIAEDKSQSNIEKTQPAADAIFAKTNGMHQMADEEKKVKQAESKSDLEVKKKAETVKKEKMHLEEKEAQLIEKSSEKATIVKKTAQNSTNFQTMNFADFSRPASASTKPFIASASKENDAAIKPLEEIAEISEQDVAQAVQSEFPELSKVEKGILEKQIHILLNQCLTVPIFTSNGDLMFQAGTRLTLDRILKAQRISPLLILNCAQNIES